MAAVANASFALPMKYARRWAWENTWSAWTLFALVLLPLATALASIPSLFSVYREAGVGAIAVVMCCGAGWGLAQVLFGLSIEAIGIGLTFSIVLGVSAAVGSLVPLLQLGGTGVGLLGPVLPGVALVLVGVFLCAAGGQLRAQAQGTQETAGQDRKPFAVGLAIALVSGLCAAAMNIGVAFGEPLLRQASIHGAAPQQVVNAVWLPLLSAGAIPNLAYCGFLLSRNKTWSNFRLPETPAYLGLALVMAVLWFFSTALYGMATTRLGDLGTIVGWPAFMSLIVVTAGLLGLMTGEWKHSGVRPLGFQLAGMLVLVLAVIALSRAQTLNSQAPNKQGKFMAPIRSTEPTKEGNL